MIPCYFWHTFALQLQKHARALTNSCTDTVIITPATNTGADCRMDSDRKGANKATLSTADTGSTKPVSRCDVIEATCAMSRITDVRPPTFV